MSLTSWIADLWDTLFPSSTDISTDNDMVISRRTTSTVDLTFSDTVNTELTKKIFYNTLPGYKLGGQLCATPILVPLAFMGLPHFSIKDIEKMRNSEFWEKRFEFYNEKYIKDKQNLHLLNHRDGTVIIWPWFDSQKGFVRWKYINPLYVTRAFIDPMTDEILGFVTVINYYFYGLPNREYNYTETTTFTKEKVFISRTGDIPPGMRTEEIKRNPIGIIPIIFTNNREPGEFGGRSDLERILPHIKIYSEINYRAHEEVYGMRTKLVQEADDVTAWRKNNNMTDITDVSIDALDFIINKKDKEKSEFITPKNLIDNHQKLLEIDFKNIVEGGLMPEIFWGGKASSGNRASSEEHKQVLFSYVKKKQNQLNDPYNELLFCTVYLDSIAYIETIPEETEVTWNDLDAMSKKEKSEIFKNYADGLDKMLNNHSIDLESAHKIIQELLPGIVTIDFDEFVKQIKEYGNIASFLDGEYTDQKEFGGEKDKEEIV